MNLSLFIADRINRNENSAFSSFIVKLAIISVTLGVSVMIITTCLVLGFKNQIKSKVFDFWGHIHLNSPEYNQAIEPRPLRLSTTLLDSIRDIRHVPYIEERSIFGMALPPKEKLTETGIEHIQGIVQVPGILTVHNQIEGLVLKGVGSAFDTTFLNKYLLSGDGSLKDDSSGRTIIISQTTASRLKLKANTEIVIYFVIGGKQIGRKFQISGIYNTGLEEYDQKFAICSASVLQQLLNWHADEYTGYEIFVKNLDDLEPINNYLYSEILPTEVFSSTIRNKFPGIFEWLQLQDYNEIVILGLMIIVCMINMITILFIFILNRLKMIGILKTLGMKNRDMQIIFLMQASRIIIFGLIGGNLLGLGLAWIQYHFKLIQLNEADYYLSIAPIEFSFSAIIMINIFTLIVIMAFLIIPSMIISRISPVKTIEYN
ncbi:MAG TPA: FtsX-like permease family protein [Saprospiraceae bacterium]|nr:FtsX-like permease family protein [Saprospiraceae bacterium]